MKKIQPIVESSRSSRSWVILLVILVVVVAALLTREIRSTVNSGNFDRHNRLRNPLERLPQGQAPLTRPDNIGPWMTFKYIGFAFGVPDEYLKSSLHIEDKNFPNISIGKYAKSLKMDPSLFIESVKSSIRTYLQEHPKTLTGATLSG